MMTLLMAAVIGLRPLAGDNTAQVVEAASRLGDGDTLRFEKGEYHFHERAGKDLFLASPGCETGMKKALIHLKGLKDVTVDGGGSHFVFHENVFPFVFEGCERVKLRGFTSDVAQLSVAEFVCEEKTKEGFLCRFTSKDIPYSIDDRGVITFAFEGGSVSSEIQEISVHALKWCQIHYLCGPSCRRNKDTLASTFFTARAEDRGDGCVFFRYFDEKHPKHVGEFPFRTDAPLAFLLGCARNRSLAAIHDCRGVTVEDVHVRTGMGMGLVADMCEDVRISRYKVRPEDGRFVSLTADTMYLVDCKGLIEINGCEISWAMDDALNIHGNYTQLKAVDGRRIRVRHPHPAYNGYFPYRDGERLEFSRGYGSKRETLGEATVAAFRAPADREAREFEIELDRTVPSDWLNCDVANLSHAPKIRIHDNHFHDFMHIRLSAFADVVFESNRIENGNSVMMVDDLKGYWGECGPVHDLTVRNNEIVSCRHHCFDIHVPITGRAVFENNRIPERFRDRPFTFGSALSAEDRRKFAVSEGATAEQAPALRFGVLGDVHIDQRHFGEHGGGHSVEAFRTALRCLGARAVDGVVIAGDLTQDGGIAELKRLEATWREVFPGGRRSDGGRIERLFVFGDHDVEKPYLYMKYWPDQLKDSKLIADMTTNHIAYIDRAKVWKDVFGEDFQPIMRKTVKGYDFVLAHLVNLDEDGMRYADPLHIPGLEEFFATNSFDRAKPFFYVQHKIPRGTVGGPFQSGQDSGRTTAILSRYPNAVGFNGHKHRTATEELSLWQGAFTQIQAPGLATLLTAAGRENSRCSCEAPCSTPPQQMEALDTRFDGSHALIVSVYGDRLVVERIDVLHDGEPVAEPWVVPWPNDGRAAYEVRGKTAGVPQFAAGAEVSVAKRVGRDRAGAVTNQVVVSFPPARSPRAYDYEVTAILSKGVVTRIVSQKRVYSPKCYWPERYDTNDVVCVFGRAEIPDNHESVKFVVRPMNAWGKAGKPIESKPDAYWSKGPLYPF